MTGWNLFPRSIRKKKKILFQQTCRRLRLNSTRFWGWIFYETLLMKDYRSSERNKFPFECFCFQLRNEERRKRRRLDPRNLDEKRIVNLWIWSDRIEIILFVAFAMRPIIIVIDDFWLNWVRARSEKFINIWRSMERRERRHSSNFLLEDN